MINSTDRRKFGHHTVISVFTVSGYDKWCHFGNYFKEKMHFKPANRFWGLEGLEGLEYILYFTNTCI